MPLQQFVPLSHSWAAPRGFSAAWGGGRGSEAPSRPLSLHSQVFITFQPPRSQPAQATFTARKETRVPPCCLTSPPGPREDPSLARSCLQGHSHATCPECSGETEAPSSPPPSVFLQARAKLCSQAPGVQLRLGVGSGAPPRDISYSHSDQGHYLLSYLRAFWVPLKSSHLSCRQCSYPPPLGTS